MGVVVLVLQLTAPPPKSSNTVALELNIHSPMYPPFA
jgi:hypothetical protein